MAGLSAGLPIFYVSGFRAAVCSGGKREWVYITCISLRRKHPAPQMNEEEKQRRIVHQCISSHVTGIASAEAIKATGGNMAKPQRPNGRASIPPSNNHQLIHHILQDHVFEESAAGALFPVIAKTLLDIGVG